MKRSLGFSCALAVVVGIGLLACTAAPPASETGATESTGAPESTGTAESAVTGPAGWVDGSVAAFQAIDGNVVYVLGTNGNLWLETGTMANRTLVRAGVKSFQVANGTVWSLDTTGNLYRQVAGGGFVFVDGTVASFQALGPTLAYVLGTDGKLWRENGDYTARGAPVDYTVKAFRGIDQDRVFVLGTDDKLWREDGDWTERTPVDASVASFFAADASVAYVLGTDSALWREPIGFPRARIDGAVKAFAPLDASTVFVVGTDGKLWREIYDYLRRDLVDTNVAAVQPVSRTVVYVLRADGTLIRDVMAAESCTFSYPPSICPWAFAEAWAVQGVPTTCPDLVSPSGRWKKYTPPTGGGADCRSAFPSGDCCTYSWVPDVAGTPQDPAPLCAGPGVSAQPIYQCPSCIGWSDAGKCDHPGSGGCDTCMPIGIIDPFSPLDP
jgi:hypothetical protein